MEVALDHINLINTDEGFSVKTEKIVQSKLYKDRVYNNRKNILNSTSLKAEQYLRNIAVSYLIVN